jgi:hypothetical protein
MRELRWCAALMQRVCATLISTFKVNNLRNLLFAQSPTRLNEHGFARVWHGARGIVPECRPFGTEHRRCRERKSLPVSRLQLGERWQHSC